MVKEWMRASDGIKDFQKAGLSVAAVK